jgi:polar amino acid transport system substrate-binding protein
MTKEPTMDTGVTTEITTDLAGTGRLRASINLGNPVLAQGTPDVPTGVTVDIARELATRLGVSLELRCFHAARDSFEAMNHGQADICFLAVDPAREATVVFTAPYAVIEAVFVVPDPSPVHTVADVDRSGVRIGVRKGSAYDLFLTRHLVRATVVRGSDGITVFEEERLEVAAGIRQPIHAFAGSHPGARIVEPPFMQIRQAVGTTRTCHHDTQRFLRGFVEELKAGGFIAASLERSGQDEVTVAPLESH